MIFDDFCFIIHRYYESRSLPKKRDHHLSRKSKIMIRLKFLPVTLNQNTYLYDISHVQMVTKVYSCEICVKFLTFCYM